MRKILVMILILSMIITPALGNGNHQDETSKSNDTQSLGLTVFLVTLIGISLVVAGFLYMLSQLQSDPGVLPLRKLTIVAIITIVVNAIIFGILYVEI